jgi:type IV secretion system protein VirB7
MGVLAILSGCATLSYPLPKCDGYAKRPLNRSMWDWEAGKAQGSKQSSLPDTSPNAAFAAEPSGSAIQTAAFAGFDEAASHAACRAG